MIGCKDGVPEFGKAPPKLLTAGADLQKRSTQERYNSRGPQQVFKVQREAPSWLQLLTAMMLVGDRCRGLKLINMGPGQSWPVHGLSARVTFFNQS